jgi:metal-responsive CopG/Arc/MetJ family transcriptional regulator
VAIGGKMQNMDKAQKISVSIPTSVIEQVKAMAQKEGRSFSNMLVMLAKEGARQRKAA